MIIRFQHVTGLFENQTDSNRCFIKKKNPAVIQVTFYKLKSNISNFVQMTVSN